MFVNPSAVERAKARVEAAKKAEKQAREQARESAHVRRERQAAVRRWQSALKKMKEGHAAYQKIKDKRAKKGENSWPVDRSTGFFTSNGKREWEKWHDHLKTVMKPPYKAPAGKRWTKNPGHYTWHLVEM